jgi:L-alanine-DL-glutamate epimerase-like enolase superfamily enzyme
MPRTPALNRRQFLAASAAAAATLGPQVARGFATAAADDSPVRLHHLPSTPVVIEQVEILRAAGNVFIRTRSREGTEGVSLTNGRDYLIPLMKDRIIPFFLGKDARDLPGLLEGVYRHESNYKLAGLAFWNPVGWLEVSLLDLLGRVANQSIAAMLGGVRRREVPIYVSSTQRDIEPEAEADRFLRRMADTGARAVKCKVGGRMSRNADASPGRTERIVPVLRTRLGDDVTLYADANGSYDVPRGIEVGRLLEAHGVAIYEEPCTT